jgi:RNA polymerase sigma-70 factor (ECF subfamily)
MGPNETSLSLLELVRNSPDGESWDRLHQVYAPLLRQWIGRHQVQASDADDLVQDVLVVVARELPRFNHNERPGAFRSWLRTILVNRLREFWRSRKYRPQAAGGSSWAEKLDQLADERSDASREWNLEHDRHVMARLLEQVRPRFEAKTWEAFHRQVFDGQRADAVAKQLGMPTNSVYVARSRVLSALRREAAGLIDET